MKHKTKQKDLICSCCGYVYPLKVDIEVQKIKGFKYCYCFRCGQITKHQTIDKFDLYMADLKSKTEEELTQKDKILKKALRIK